MYLDHDIYNWWDGTVFVAGDVHYRGIYIKETNKRLGLSPLGDSAVRNKDHDKGLISDIFRKE